MIERHWEERWQDYAAIDHCVSVKQQLEALYDSWKFVKAKFNIDTQMNFRVASNVPLVTRGMIVKCPKPIECCHSSVPVMTTIDTIICAKTTELFGVKRAIVRRGEFYYLDVDVFTLDRTKALKVLITEAEKIAVTYTAEVVPV